MSSTRGLIALLVLIVGATAFFLMSEGDDALDATPGSTAAANELERDDGAPATGPSIGAEADGPTRAVAESGATPAHDSARAAADGDEDGDSGLRVTGRVVDEGGRPLANVDVRLGPSIGRIGVLADHDEDHEKVRWARSQRVKTGSDGRFSFDDVQHAKLLSVRARPGALCDVTRPLPDQKEGELALGDLVATLGGSLTGYVLDERGNGIRGANVRAWTKPDASSSGAGLFVLGGLASGEGARTATTDGSGFFRIDGLPPGEAIAIADKDGYTRQSLRDITIERGGITSDVKIELSEGFMLAGSVVDRNGAPVADARVSVMETVIDLSDGSFTSELGKDRTVSTDAGGRFEIGGLKTGTYNVTAHSDGYVRKAERAETGTTDVRIVLDRSGVVWGYVRDRESKRSIAEFELGAADLFLSAAGIHGADDARQKILRGKDVADLVGVEPDVGLYAITNIATKDVTVHVTADGYTDFERPSIAVAPEALVRVDAELVPEITVSGVVLDPMGDPVVGAQVIVAKNERVGGFAGGVGRFERRIAVRAGDGAAPEVIQGSYSERATTDAAGRFTVRGLAEGDYVLTANHDDWARSEPLALELVEAEQVDGIEVELREGGGLTGTAYDADGNPLSAATVRLHADAVGDRGTMVETFDAGPEGWPGEGAYRAETALDGTYEIRGIVPGPYRAELFAPTESGAMGMVFMSLDGGAKKGTPVSIEAGETATIDLHLPPAGTVSGLVTEAGRPLAAASVSLAKKGERFPFGGPSTKTDSRGEFQMNDVEPASYTMKVRARGAAIPVERDVEVRAREKVHETINLPTGVIAGRVTDEDSGDPLADVTIEVAPVRERGEESQTTSHAVFAVRVNDGGSGGGMTSFSFGNEDEVITTDEDGRYEARFLEPGDYQVSISGGGVEKAQKDRVRVLEGQRNDHVDFEAIRGATLIITPRHNQDEPLDFFRVSYYDEANPGEVEQQMHLGESSVLLPGLRAGRYHVTVQSGSMRGEQRIEVSSGEEKRVEIPIQ